MAVDTKRGRIRGIRKFHTKLRRLAARDGKPGKRQALEATARLAAIVTSSMDAIVSKTLDGTVRSWNEGAARLFGYRPEEMIGQPIRRLIPPDRPDEVDLILARIAAGETMQPYETVRLHKDGRAISVSVAVSPIRDAAGTIIGASKIVRDISGQKQAEAALRESEARFRATFENAAVGIAHVAAGGTWLRVNRCLCKITGYPEDELLAKTFQDITHPDDIETDLAHVKRMLDGEIGSYGMEKRYVRRDGSFVWVRLTVGAVRKSDNTIDYFIAIIEDISDQKRAEEELRVTTGRFELAIKGSPIAVFSQDLDLRYTWIYNTTLGIEPSEFIGKYDSDIFEKAEDSAVIEALKREVIRTGQGRRQEVLVRWKGVNRFYDLLVDPLRDANGTIAGVTCAAIDITGRKQAEEALRESEERFRALTDNISQFAWIADRSGSVTWYNKRWYDYTGTTLDEMAGWGWKKVHHPDHLDRVVFSRAEAFRAGKDWEETFPLRGKDGQYRWFLSRAMPIRNEAGEVVRWFGTNTDVTDLREAHMALRQSEERLRLANEAACIGTFTVDLEKDRAYYSPELAAILGFPGVESASVEDAMARVHRDDLPRVHGMYSAAIRGANGGYLKMDFRFVLPGGAIRWMTWIGQVHFREGPDGLMPFRIAGACLDITERKHNELRINLLLREVNHRAKNMLTLVQAVARRTVAASPDDFIDRFGERIQALAASQDLLVKSEWKGVDLGELIRSQLAHFKDLIGTRIEVRGPPLVISAPAAQAIGMAVHELATNAGKYGALSTGSGIVEVSWSLERHSSGEERFLISWRERGGVPVQAPSRQGFGSTVISRMAAESLDAEVGLDFAPEGLSWRLECPAAEVVGIKGTSSKAQASPP